MQMAMSDIGNGLGDRHKLQENVVHRSEETRHFNLGPTTLASAATAASILLVRPKQNFAFVKIIYTGRVLRPLTQMPLLYFTKTITISWMRKCVVTDSERAIWPGGV